MAQIIDSMKRLLLFIFASLNMLTVFSQSYNDLWKQVDQAEEKDLPKTQIEILEKIVSKATKEKAYGHLLAAEFKKAGLQTSITPDSLQSEIAQIESQMSESNDSVLKAVYCAVLGKIYSGNASLGRQHDKIGADYFAKALANPELLASQQYTGFIPMITKRSDSEIFNHDLLHVIGMEAGAYQQMFEYYSRARNTEGQAASSDAACLLALKMLQQRKDALSKRQYLAAVDSLIATYQDTPACGEIAIERYYAMPDDATQRYHYAQEAAQRWSTWKRAAVFTNEMAQLTAPMFNSELKEARTIPYNPYVLNIKEVRNLQQLTLKVYQLKATGETELELYDSKRIEKVKNLIMGDPYQVSVRSYPDKQAYEMMQDSIIINGLPVGVYLIEMSADNSEVKPQYAVFYVSDVFVIWEEQPENVVRYAVVNATTGQPIPDAKIKLSLAPNSYGKGNDDRTKILQTDEKGEVLFNYGKQDPRWVYAYTTNDKASPKSGAWCHYNYNGTSEDQNYIRIYTDRSIYRPGQTLHVAAVAYRRYEKTKHTTSAYKTVTIRLQDANYQLVSEKTVTTDSFGTAAVDFTLPASGLTGNFTIKARADVEGSTTIRVEEYKRPTFQIEFSDYKEQYAHGDTISVEGFAKTYAGMPVQGAKVKYTVSRRNAWWCWWNYFGNEAEELYDGEAVTDETGAFRIDMPMLLPFTKEQLAEMTDANIRRRGLFYNITADVQVTDLAGESHNGQFTLPLGTKPTTLTCDLPEKSLCDSLRSITFHYNNAAGQPIDGRIKFSVGGKAFAGGKSYAANTAIALPRLSSGRHTIIAVCGTDTLRQEVATFSMNDKTPVINTHDWFYITDNEFPNDGKPVYVQFGSSDKAQHVVYSIFAKNYIIESGVVDQSNALTTRTLYYQDEYDGGITVTCAWVKDGVMYQHSECISAPKPDTRLKLEWKTFRDRLTPGQKEEWTLSVCKPGGKPADAQLLATLYDKSLDQIVKHSYSLNVSFPFAQPYVGWLGQQQNNALLNYHVYPKTAYVGMLEYAQFDTRYLEYLIYGYGRPFGRVRPMKIRGRVAAGMVLEEMRVESSVMMSDVALEKNVASADDAANASDADTQDSSSDVQMRENLDETAFFYPQLHTDANGIVTMTFTLPESITTWRFLGVAHDKMMNTGGITGEAIASKTVMVQPNMPRFIREGDRATITAKLMNTSDKEVSGKARMEIIDPSTDKVLFATEQDYTIASQRTSSAMFQVDPKAFTGQSLLIVKVMAVGDGYSDGEQHYLPVLPQTEHVINTLPFTIHGAGETKINLTSLFPENTTQQRLTVEYTNHPAWLMIQALPFVADLNEHNAISLSAAFYANSLARNILTSVPKMKQIIEQWRNEAAAGAQETTMQSNLQKNQSLKELLLTETPWVMDAQNEAEQKQNLIQFFDENSMNQRLKKAITLLGNLQNSNGSWSWWEGMSGNLYMTVAVSKTLVRLNTILGPQDETTEMLTDAFKYMRREIAKEVVELKKLAKKGYKELRPSETAVSYLYLCALDGRKMPASAKADYDYLVALLSKKTTELTIYGKATSAIILAKSGYEKKAAEYLQSIKEYSVFTEEMGRYFDTRKAYYSWFDYKIPTEVAAIEAIQTITPSDRQIVEEMQLWLLQEKRTQAWDTPVNAVDAIYAFFGSQNVQNSQDDTNTQSTQNNLTSLISQNSLSTLTLDGKPLETSAATAGVGYVKTSLDVGPYSALVARPSTLVIEKTDTDTSWGAVYAQFQQQVTEITDAASGIKVTREIVASDSQSSTLNSRFSIGDRVKVRITVIADRDYDFVQLIDKRAACMEPLQQLSGYRGGYYQSTKDCTTNYYFDRMSKGKHEIETEYYIDRAGEYTTGTCTVQCAYAPEYSGRARGESLNVDR